MCSSIYNVLTEEIITIGDIYNYESSYFPGYPAVYLSFNIARDVIVVSYYYQRY